MSLISWSSNFQYTKRRLGAYVNLCLLFVLGLWNGTNQSIFAKYCATHSQSYTLSLLKLIPEQESTFHESINLQQNMSVRGWNNPFSSYYNLVEGEILGFRLFEGASYVNLAYRDSLHFLVHSVYDVESIGNLSLAIDQQGRLYLQEVHVCGGINNYYATEKDSLKTMDNYVHNMKSDVNGKPIPF